MASWNDDREWEPRQDLREPMTRADALICLGVGCGLVVLSVVIMAVFA